MVLALEVERGLLLGSALPSDEFALFYLGASEHSAGGDPLAHLLDGGDGVLDLAVHLSGVGGLRCRCYCIHCGFCRRSSSITSERTRIVRFVAFMAGSFPDRIQRRTVSG